MKRDNLGSMTDWDNFEVVQTRSSITGIRSYYQSYLEFKDIVANLPKTELQKRGWISSEDDIASLVPMFEKIHSNKLGPLFRKHDESKRVLWLAWLSRVSTSAKYLVSLGKIEEYRPITKGDLKNIAQLSQNISVVKELPNILSKLGIVLIYEQGLPRMKLDGVVFLLESGHPVIGMSFRYPRVDNFWFTLMHELSHILLHISELQSPIFDDLEDSDADVIESQANRLAKNSLVEKSLWRNCKAKYSRNESDIISFSKEAKLHPSIVAGMLQREQNTFNLYRKIVDETNLRKEVFGDE
ncbi:MAG: ImmA/IrrE family metallo-endopeptidase [Deltaproteobacteria bacterium]|jgi:HTH-type transcriptional regulator / antitoxin HigA|nr:ImmA/IrrE family metallo-endopeptidase [Deltaproteobacteria bacterium]MBT4639536.1 ImmA/IrrE family metallo-endopeptidase [Deltaproteobacteria bacterium]MBT7711237.1 ImmA/IrrE family metallo-endopeptidase [Deltaproteobacteria bacterium]